MKSEQTCTILLSAHCDGERGRGGGRRGADGRLEVKHTFENIRLAFFHSLERCLHEEAGKLAGIDALLPPLVNSVRHPHPYDAMPAHVNHMASVHLVICSSHL